MLPFLDVAVGLGQTRKKIARSEPGQNEPCSTAGLPRGEISAEFGASKSPDSIRKKAVDVDAKVSARPPPEDTIQQRRFGEGPVKQTKEPRCGTQLQVYSQNECTSEIAVGLLKASDCASGIATRSLSFTGS